MSLLIAFSGQGSQHRKMFHSLSEDSFGNSWLKQASQIMNVDLFDESAVEKACSDVVQVQCLLVILSVGAFYALNKQVKLEPAFLCGYSLGEISAFAVSADLELTEICSLVKNRALFMQDAANEFANNQQTGLVVLKGRINYALVNELNEVYDCHLAIINADDHYIVGGLLTKLEALETEARARGVLKVELLAVKLASHTPLLAKATERFSNYLQKFKTCSMQYPILNALTQELSNNTQAMLTILARELSQALHWDRVMGIAAEYGISFFLELGPRAALKNMILAKNPQLKAYSLEDFSSLGGLVRFLKSL